MAKRVQSMPPAPWTPRIAPEPPSGEVSAVLRRDVSPSDGQQGTTPSETLTPSQPTQPGPFIPRGRRVHPRDMWGAAEVCAYVGWKQRKSILDAMRTAGFPQPCTRIAAGAIWDAGRVRKWVERKRSDRHEPSTEEQAQ